MSRSRPVPGRKGRQVEAESWSGGAGSSALPKEMASLTKYWACVHCTISFHKTLLIDSQLLNRDSKKIHYIFNFGETVFANWLVSDLSGDQL